MITAIGVSYLLQNIALLIFGADTKSFSSVVPLQNIKIGGITITGVTVVAVLACIVIMIGLMILLKRQKQDRQCWQYPRIRMQHSLWG